MSGHCLFAKPVTRKLKMHLNKATTLSPESIERFRNWCIVRGQSSNTAKAYSTDLRMFLSHLGTTSLDMETEFELAGATWLNETRKEASPKTTGRRLTSLRAFARWSGYPGLMLDYKAPTPAKGQPHPIPEGIEGLERMLRVAKNPDQRMLIALCGFVGMRLGEALDARTTWFNPHNMRMTIRGKGDKERIVPVSPRAWSIMSGPFTQAMIGSGYLIDYQDRSARKAITSMGRRAGLSRPIASHDLRATFATEVFNRTGNMRLVQELLGHANITTTEIYTGVAQAALIDAVDF